jgi:cold shock CspA family protein
MLWFNIDKGYGFIRTEGDERLYVARSDFLPDHQPALRSRGREVIFERREVEGDVRAVTVAFDVQSDPRRARLRHARGGRAL